MITNTTQLANREGLDLELYDYATYDPQTSDAPLMTINFANQVSWNLSGDGVWATGGKYKSKKINFQNPWEGTFTINTQIITPQLRKLQAGGDISDTSNLEAVFTNRSTQTRYYVIKGKTLWKDENDVYYSETICAFKAAVQRKFDGDYQGEGDPQSNEIVFELATNENDDIFSCLPEDVTTTP